MNPKWPVVSSFNHGWSREILPALRVESGATVQIKALDASGGQFSSSSTSADIAKLNFERVNPVTGPIFIEGAMPGDAIRVELLEFKPSGWGWTGIIPGFGLLAEEFGDPHLIGVEYDKELAVFLPGVAHVPTKFFAGEIGLAPAEPGVHSAVPPRRVGGNLDTRDLSTGSTLFLPVEVEGGLFSLGDTHAAQGDGEVCGTAIESAMDVTVRLSVDKQRNLPAPQFITAGPVSKHHDAQGYFVTTGIGPDLLRAAQDAVRAMIDHMGREYNIAPKDAYCLCSVATDLRITEIVDMPNVVVACYLPLAVMV